MGICHGLFGWGGWTGLGGSWLGLILNTVLFASVLTLLGLAGVGADPLEIARRRLAAGEITIPEFEEIRDRLRD
jgi:uncharacterized membrane protein